MTDSRSTARPEKSADNAAPEDGARSSHRRDAVARVTILVLSILLSAEALAIVSRWRANRARLNEILLQLPASGTLAADGTAGDNSTGSSSADASTWRVEFERTPHHAKLTVARTLVYQALAFGDVVPPGGQSARPGSAEAVAQQLPVARELALEVLSQQPNNWQASMFLGAATYLDWSLHSDRRLYTAADQWEQPLLKAIEQAAGKSEPRRFLAAAYLETWEALSSAKRDFTRQLVKTMFLEDPDSFDRLGPVWFEVAGDREPALEVIPDLPKPWIALKRSFAEKQDWDSFCLAHGRYFEAFMRQLARDLDEAEQRLRLGDVAGGRQICLAVVVSSPRDGLFADLVRRALELYPPGLRGLRSRSTLKSWLRWALELHEIGIDPFSPRVISRLTDAIGELDTPTGALAALIADDAYQVNRYEKLADSKHAKEWAPFLIARSRWLTDREELDAAEMSLGEVHRSARESAPYWLARRRLALATGDLADLGTADERLAAFRSRRWRASDWRWRGRRVTLGLYPEVRGVGLQVTIDKAPAGGAVAELLWDGTSVTTLPIATRQTIEIEIEVESRPHLLELRSLAGGEIQPGPVRLLESQ